MAPDKKKRATIYIAIVYVVLTFVFGWMDYIRHDYPTFNKSLLMTFLQITPITFALWIPSITPSGKRGVLYSGVLTFIVAAIIGIARVHIETGPGEWGVKIILVMVLGGIFGMVSVFMKDMMNTYDG